jgi:asparagine synthase (glutamine-hydrolysing)
MTGIFYYQAKKGNAIPKHVREAASSIGHRGKHYSWILEDTSSFAAVYLNKPQQHNLLVESGTSKELASSFSVLDGYIDTGTELAASVGGQTRESKNQVETARLLYKMHGIEAFSQIVGSFAILIKEKEGLTIASDPFGTKPLYYKDDEEKLVIASELKAFRGVDNFPRLLEPGTAFWIHGSTSGIKRFYDIRSLGHRVEGQEPINASNVAAELYALLDRAVKRSIPSDAKTSALLSGGLDSSIICALALSYVPVLDAYVISYGDSEDLVYARRFADRYQDRVRLHTAKFTLEDMLRLIPDVIKSLETFDAALIRSAVPMYIACSNIAAGTDVLLTGEGSDELFAGYSYLEGVSPDAMDEELFRLLDVEYATGLQRVDRIPYRFGIEARAPWFDLELAHLAFQLPAKLKIKRDRGAIIEKWIVREAFKHLLPDEITWRKKAKFSQGTGSELVMRDYLQAKISDAEFTKEKEVLPGVYLRSKEELYYWRLFKEFFEPSADFVRIMPRTGQFTI